MPGWSIWATTLASSWKRCSISAVSIPGLMTLSGHVAVEPRVVGPVDHTHPPPAELGDDLVPIRQFPSDHALAVPGMSAG